MSNRLLVKSLPIVAAAMGKKHGVTVSIREDMTTAATNGKQIFLPVLPDTDEALTLARGYIDHESAHIRYTDFEINMGKGLRKSIINILEDIRIEQKLSCELPGCKINLEGLEKAFVEGGVYNVVTDQSHPAEILIARIHHCLRVGVLNNLCTSDLATNAYQVYANAFPADTVKAIDELLQEADSLRDTAHVCDLTDRILAVIKEDQPEEEQEQSDSDCDESSEQGDSSEDDSSENSDQSTGSENDDSEEAEDQESGQDDGEDDQSQSSDKGDDDSSGSNADKESENSDDGDEGDDSSDAGGSSDESEDDGDDSGDADETSEGDDSEGDNGDSSDADSESSDKDSSEDEGQEKDNGSDGDESSENDDDSEGEDAEGGQAGEEGQADESDDAKKKNLQALRDSEGQEVVQDTDLGDKIKQMLEDLSFEAKCHGSNSGTFPVQSPRACGVPVDPFEVARETNALRTRLNGLIQASKLKRSPPRRVGHRIDTRSLHKLSTLDTRVFRGRESKPAVNTAVQILIDQSGSMRGDKVDATKAAMAVSLALETIPGVKLAIAGFNSVINERGDRYIPSVSPMKSFSQRTDKQCFVPHCGGGTPIAEALWWSASELLSLNTVERRIVFCITDGGPDDYQSTVDIVGKLKTAGIETNAIGIGVGIDRELFPVNCTISGIHELPEKVFAMLEDLLIVSQ
jgi:hypothetical protein